MLLKRIDAAAFLLALAVVSNGLSAHAQDASSANGGSMGADSSQQSSGGSPAADPNAANSNGGNPPPVDTGAANSNGGTPQPTDASAGNANGGNPAGGGAPPDPNSKPSDWVTSDGYDPDKDASLHPKGQDPRVRMIENARAQQKHEEELKAKKEAQTSAGKDPKKDAGGARLDSSAKTGDAKAGDAKKDDAKKDGDKKDDTASKEDKDKEDAKAKEAKEEAKKQKALEKQAASMKYTPLHDALFALQCGKYSDSVNVLTKYVAANAKDVQAHYLLAVSYVGMRMYQQAIEQYKAVIGLAPNSKVAALATEGLKKIQH